MFDRAILNQLEAWAAGSPRKPLLVRGARQVGKTVAVRLFAKRFDTFLELNLERPEDAALFERDLSVEDLWQSLLLARNIEAPPGGRLLLFLDEIQNSPRAMQSLRYFYERLPQVHVIAAGSLLEALLDRQPFSFPVGRVESLYLRPLTFREFLAALGQDQAVAALDQAPFPAYAHETLLRHFQRYALIGGMPEVVARYRERREVAGLGRTYDALLTGYVDDIAKYGRNATQRAVLRHCIERAPFEAGCRISFAGFGRSSYGSREVGEALRTLERVLLVTLLPPTTSTALPIEPDFRKKPRLQLLDTGLINHVVALQQQYFAHDDLHGVYRGRIAEHVVGQELLAIQESAAERLCFWVRDKSQSTAEVDFLLAHAGHLVPIEVKAGKTGTLRSLHQLVDATALRLAVRMYAGPLELQRLQTPRGQPYTLLNLPYFLTGTLRAHLDWAFERL